MGTWCSWKALLAGCITCHKVAGARFTLYRLDRRGVGFRHLSSLAGKCPPSTDPGVQRKVRAQGGGGNNKCTHRARLPARGETFRRDSYRTCEKAGCQSENRSVESCWCLGLLRVLVHCTGPGKICLHLRWLYLFQVWDTGFTSSQLVRVLWWPRTTRLSFKAAGPRPKLTLRKLPGWPH